MIRIWRKNSHLKIFQDHLRRSINCWNVNSLFQFNFQATIILKLYRLVYHLEKRILSSIESTKRSRCRWGEQLPETRSDICRNGGRNRPSNHLPLRVNECPVSAENNPLTTRREGGGGLLVENRNNAFPISPLIRWGWIEGTNEIGHLVAFYEPPPPILLVETRHPAGRYNVLYGKGIGSSIILLGCILHSCGEIPLLPLIARRSN